MIQQLLTVTIEFSTIAAFGLFSIAFAHSIAKRQEYRTIAQRFRQRQAALKGIANSDTPKAPAIVSTLTSSDISNAETPDNPTIIHHPSTVHFENGVKIITVDWDVEIDELTDDEEFIAELLAIAPTPQPVSYAECKVHQLRTLGSLLDIKGARRWSKQQAIDALSAA